MSKELEINGEKFYPSTVLSGRFSYTSDYLSKLTREEKVVATRVGRQWFVSEESLKNFIADTTEQKSKRSDKLSEERKQERIDHQAKVIKKVSEEESGTKSKTTNPLASISPVATHLAQSLVVTLCGALLGLLGFTVYEENITLSGLTYGAKVVMTDTIGAVSTGSLAAADLNQEAALDFSGFWDWLFGREVQVVELPVEDQAVEYEVASEKSQSTQRDSRSIVIFDKDIPTTTLPEVRESFSDEVEITFDGEDTGLITPVFKERTDESYRFLLVPVTEDVSK